MLSTRSRVRVLEALKECEDDEGSARQKVCNTSDEEDQDSKDLARRERRRKKIIKEIFDTERTYQKHLELIVKYFADPLTESQLVPKHVQATIFSNIRNIIEVNKELLEQLETTSIGDAFLSLAPFLKLYSMYANNHEHALGTLLEWEQKKPEFSAFRRAQEEESEVMGLKFNALLITPVQRIPRYKLLLEDLLENTPPEDDDYKALKDAAIMIAGVAAHINEHIKEHDNFQKMLAIQNNLTGNTAPRIVAPGRRFIKDGMLKKVSRTGGSSHERMFFLFSDMLLYAKPVNSKYVCCCVFPLHHCYVERMLGDLFKVTCKNESVLLFSEDKKTVSSWITALEEAIGVNKECRQTLRKESSAKQPMRRTGFLRMKKQEKRKLSDDKKENGKGSKKGSGAAVPVKAQLKQLLEQNMSCITPRRKRRKLLSSTSSNDGCDVPSSPESCENTSPNIDAFDMDDSYQTDLKQQPQELSVIKEQLEEENSYDNEDQEEDYDKGNIFMTSAEMDAFVTSEIDLSSESEPCSSADTSDQQQMISSSGSGQESSTEIYYTSHGANLRNSSVHPPGLKRNNSSCVIS
ncbi:rho guanine nucleotide exchange factor 39 [Lingula anatina]|uniref:Rho guanine nucleotide exchange factor 39 n=1 Tax=Lingula anatina TaxID=7574 RepID=A0A1S3IVK6_LINAN|nr:rho guanine nucleotide exchange factor 39 [Lingula anatina]|eukprot:XP_013402225.1 rho guanine nucleotide exchange factor 39 [Lingula anatina]